MRVVAEYLGLTIDEAEECIKKGLNPESIPGAVHEQTTHNIITNVGLDLFVKRLKDIDTTTSRITHFAVGTGDTTPAVTQTTLGTEIFRDQITQSAYVSTGVILIKCYIPTAYPASQPVTLKEAGLFNSVTSGVMFARSLISPAIPKDNTISIVISWEVHAA